MKPSIKKESKEYRVVFLAFHRSLRGLEIEPTRYRALPLKQRRLALCEAVYTTAKQVSKESNWYLERSDLHSKQLWDFSPDQINQHQLVVDALIALVCLGEISFVRPLVTYLSFPESRWTILIDSLLRALSPEGIRGSEFRLPSETERSRWRKWAIEHTEPTNLRDYSYILLSDLGTEDVEWGLRVPELDDSSFLRLRNEFFAIDWKYFDEKQAAFCDRSLLPQLKSYDYRGFADLLERFVNENPSEGNFTTLVACASDWINELQLARASLKDDWLNLADHGELNSRTGAILYQILVYPKTDRRLARDFGRRLFSDEVDLQTLTAVVDILTQSYTDASIYRIWKTLSILDRLPDRSKERMLDFLPTVSMISLLWVHNLHSRELESLCIVGAEDPKRRERLVAYVEQQFQESDSTLVKLMSFEQSSDPICHVFIQQIHRFYELRQPLKNRLAEALYTTTNLINQYLELVSTVRAVLLRLPQRKSEK